ncbi:MAG: hypothetical protein JSS60_06955 [Verrucomicrobia bacterium]|nr:hypothetical protein [Verrucomicrobiota bacterium]
MSVKEATVGDALQRAWKEMCEKGYKATLGKEVFIAYQNNTVDIFKFKPDTVFFPVERTRAFDTDLGSKTLFGFKDAWKEPIKNVTLTFDKWADEEIIARTAKVYFTTNRPNKGERDFEGNWLEGQIVIKENSIWPFEHKRDQLMENQN